MENCSASHPEHWLPAEVWVGLLLVSAGADGAFELVDAC